MSSELDRTAGSARTRVLLIGKGAPDRGGIPTFLAGLLSSDVVREHDVRFLNVAHSSAPQGGRPTVRNLVRTARDTFAVWRTSRGCDVVHIHSALAPAVTVLRAGAFAVAGRLRGARIIVHAHGGRLESWVGSRRGRLILRLAMRPVAQVVAVWSGGDRVLASLLGRDRVRLIDNGVDLSSFVATDRPERRPRVLYVGLLTPRKGVIDLLEASRLLLHRGVDHELLLVGGTPDEGSQAETLVREAATGLVRLLGSRPPEQMPLAYAEADVFCLPSWWEAMPLSLLEAMASALPVVATDVGDVSRAVVHGETGYLVPPRHPVALSEALADLLTETARRRDMGAAGRARVAEMFSQDSVARKVSALYREVVRA